jgi:4-hydroxy-2-oxoglutarate aldolase
MLAGLYPPIPTPFHADERINLQQLERNLERWLAEPLDGIVMPGSNSEAAYLTHEERVLLWETCALALRGTNRRLIAGTGAETTAETIALTEGAAAYGAAAALVIPPFFYKAAMGHDVLVAHYRAVADASPIPVLLYNVPAFTGLDFALPLMAELVAHPNIVGVKDSSSNVVKMAGLLAAAPEAAIFAGTGSALLPFLSIGAAGGIVALANVAARPLRQVLELFERGDLAGARRIQLALVALNDSITTRHGVAGLKYAMDRVGLFGGPARRPLLPLGATARAEIDHQIAQLRL